MSDSSASELVHPPKAASKGAYLKSHDEYKAMYDRSISDPDGFWSEVADEFHWFKKWDKVRSYNYDRREGPQLFFSDPSGTYPSVCNTQHGLLVLPGVSNIVV